MTAWGAIALACASAPRSAMLALIVLTTASITCLLAEWQRRKTLVAVIEGARPGTVVVQDRGFGGPAMRIEIGNGTRTSNRTRDA